jgi:type II secretory pathway predicted ATPase ExeA
MEQKSIIEQILEETKSHATDSIKNLGLEFNPFPRSGIADSNTPDEIMESLSPIHQETLSSIIGFVKDSLFNKNPQEIDPYLSLIIRGDYGTGKTQTLFYIRWLLKSFKGQNNVNPYVVYIDNPGTKLSELIGSIINEIGQENFKRYLWDVFLSQLKKNESILEQLKLIAKKTTPSLFPQETARLSISEYVSYKIFVDDLYKGTDAKKKREIQDALKVAIVKSFEDIAPNTSVALYFYDLVADNIGINKTWDLLTTGAIKDIDKREFYILKAIVETVKELGYTDFIILADEFEEITAGRLQKTEVDNYLRNLRTLIDKEKNWCAVFAMTGKALSMIEQYSPPLAGRIKGRIIDLKPLNIETAKILITNYLNLARENNSSIYPFDESAISTLLEVGYTEGSPRLLLKYCYLLIQRAKDEISGGTTINTEFVKRFVKPIDK